MDPKDKQIKALKDQVKYFQDKKIELEHKVLQMSGFVEGFRNRLKFYRSAMQKGVNVKKMFMDEISEELQFDYEIAIYKHILERIQKRNFLFRWIATREINKIIEEIQGRIKLMNQPNRIKVVK